MNANDTPRAPATCHAAYLGEFCVSRFLYTEVECSGPSPYGWPAVSREARLAEVERWWRADEPRRRDDRLVRASEVHRAMLEEVVRIYRREVENASFAFGAPADEDVCLHYGFRGDEWRRACEEAEALLALDWRTAKGATWEQRRLLEAWGEVAAAAEGTVAA